MKPRFFKSAANFRAWLDRNHATASELLIGIYKKELRRGVTYPEALDEALSFGWIDGVRKRISANAYTIRFTPRKRGSIWSQVDIQRAQELIASGRMSEARWRVFRERDKAKARLYSYEREQARLDRALEATLRANEKAASLFDAQPPGYRRTAFFGF
jgi:uncharacterized protein YdeI (YjbR/CyaY-like superfamily)